MARKENANLPQELPLAGHGGLGLLSQLLGWEAEIRRSRFKAIPGKKFVQLHLNQWLGEVAKTFHPSYEGKHE
jgi:hypothetical protein